MRYLSLFSGIEAASVAWQELGWEPVAFCENDRFPSAVLAYRFPNVPNLWDITKVDWGEFKKQYGTIDLIVGGSPCQSFSTAAGAFRTSLDGKSNLMREYLRAIAAIRPQWIVWENVTGVLYTRDNAFRQLLSTLQQIGYCDISYRVIDARSFGIPQMRRRLFLVGYLSGGGFCSAAVLFNRDCLQGNTKPHDWQGEKTTATDSRSVRDSIPYTMKVRCGAETFTREDGTTGTAGKGALIGENVAFTIGAVQDQTLFVNEGGTYKARRFTPIECERLQGFPDDYTRIPYKGKPASECPDAPRRKALGNSFCVPVVRWIGERIQLVEEILNEKESAERRSLS